MLLLLTGDIQIGKTRWLEGVVDELEASGIALCGAITPGEWIQHRSGSDAPGNLGDTSGVTYEKIGIDAMLLPQRERFSFAKRADLAQGDAIRASQSESAKLGWKIDDNAIDRINHHFDAIACGDAAGVLVIDELGRLELEHGAGLVSAVKLVERGATPSIPHAIAIVREQLLPTAHTRFADAPWNGMTDIHPDEQSKQKLLKLLFAR